MSTQVRLKRQRRSLEKTLSKNEHVLTRPGILQTVVPFAQFRPYLHMNCPADRGSPEQEFATLHAHALNAAGAGE